MIGTRPIKKSPTLGSFFIGETNAINLELLLSEEYYLATMECYEKIQKSKCYAILASKKSTMKGIYKTP